MNQRPSPIQLVRELLISLGLAEDLTDEFLARLQAEIVVEIINDDQARNDLCQKILRDLIAREDAAAHSNKKPSRSKKLKEIIGIVFLSVASGVASNAIWDALKPFLLGSIKNAPPEPSGKQAPATSPVFYKVRRVGPKHQIGPAPGHGLGLGASSHELEIELHIGNVGQEKMIFDEVRATFRTPDKIWSNSVYTLKDNSVTATFSISGLQPVAQPGELFEFSQGDGALFHISTANSNFGLLGAGTSRTFIFALYRTGKIVHGPFTIIIAP